MSPRGSDGGDEARIRIDVLGPLRLAVDGVPVEVPGPKRRALLALLAGGEGRSVATPTLIDALWASDPPDTARATLHSHVSRLRGHLGRHATKLAAADGGYHLALSDGELDAAQARQLLRAARSVTDHDPERAHGLLSDARELFRGPALAELRDLLDRFAGTATTRTLEAFHAYVAGEVANASGDASHAEAQYRRAVAAARSVGASFVDGIATVGLVSVHTATGRVPDALLGSRELIDHWERTGGWIQQWTTLRNLARLLATLGDDETALLLQLVADQAAESPGVVGTQTSVADRVAPSVIAQLRARAAATSRAQVLEVARHAIDRHLH